MLKDKQIRRLVYRILAIAFIVAVITIANVAFSRSHPGGLDFLTGWAGTRAYLFSGASPYSNEATKSIQENAFGGNALNNQSGLRFTFPLYSIALFAPFALFKDFAVARGLWMTLLEAGLLAIPLISLRLLNKKLPLWMTLSCTALVMFSFHGVRPVLDGNVAILTTLLILLTLVSILKGQDEVAGITLALSTIQINVSVLFLVFVLIYAIINRRKTLLNWFFGSMILMVGFSILLIPNWILQNLGASLQMLAASTSGSPGAMMAKAWGATGVRLSVFLTVLLAGVLIIEWNTAFRDSDEHFLWTGLLTFAVSQWIGLPTTPGNFVVLFPGIILSFIVLLQRWGPRAKSIILGMIGFIFIGLWLPNLFSLKNSATTLYFMVLPAIAIILLYWIKWWMLHAVETENTLR